jgi:PucR C-terminal helix-turn-helix domain
VSSVADLWRAVDPAARLLAGSPEALSRPVRGVVRTRSAVPHLPPDADGQLLVVDGALGLTLSAEALAAALNEAGLQPAAVLVAGGPAVGSERGASGIVLLASELPAPVLADTAGGYLAEEQAWLASLAKELRLACAEAGLAEPEPSAPAGLVAARMRRGVAVDVDGDLQALHARPAGRALAARFAAIHRRLLASGSDSATDLRRRTLDGLWLVERRIRAGASVWLFDDVPLAAVDEVAAGALTVTLRALLRRPAAGSSEGGRRPAKDTARAPVAASLDLPPVLRDTVLAVARANGRTAPAARQLGVHRNTVLYRLRRAEAESGLDPRRPEDALRILGSRAPEQR